MYIQCTYMFHISFLLYTFLKNIPPFIDMNRHFFISIFANRKWLLIFCLCLSMTGCSPGFIYTNLDWIIPWYADDYVELNSKQAARFTVIVDNAIAWHKREELPRYYQYLQDAHNKLDRPLDDDDISDMQLFTNSSIQSLQQYIVPGLLPLFKTLNADQRQTLWGNLEKKQAEYEQEFLSRSNQDYVDDLKKKHTELTERLLGFLTADQHLIVENSVSDGIRADDIWLKARRAWLSDIKIQSEKKTNDWHTRVQAAWLARDQHYSAADKLTLDARDQQARQLLLMVINRRTDKQTEYFKQLIQSWRNRFSSWQERPSNLDTSTLNPLLIMKSGDR